MEQEQFSLYTGTRTVTFSLDKKDLLYNALPVQLPGREEDMLIQEALDHPVGTEPLEKIIAENGKTVVLVDDATRSTPCARILPHLLERLERRTRNITIVTAPGTHRPMTQAELEQKIGAPVMAKYPVLNLDYTKDEEYRYVRTTRLGTPVSLHQSVLEADHIISIGNIVPHVVVGWSGGAKTLQPGVSARETTDYTHWLGAISDHVLDVCGNIDCICRGEVDEIGSYVNLSFIVNTVLNEKGEILGLFCGDYLQAHRAGVEMAQKVLRPEIPALADIVIVSAYPAHIDFWQAFKPFAYAQFGVREGGAVIFLFDAPEGICGNAPFHLPALEQYFPKPLDEILAEAERDEIEDRVGATNPINHHKIIDRARVICISQGLREEDFRLLGFERAETVERALEMARETLGPDAKVGVIPFGGDTLPQVRR